MPPLLAALICIIFILCLFWMDIQKNDHFSNAIWIPLAWMFLAGSRYVAQWLNLSAPGPIDEGNPLNAASFFVLIGGGVLVLLRRKVDWNLVIRQNKLLWLYLLYCGISIAWSDYPFISFKRFIKELGNLVMVLVILTEKQPYEAFAVVLRRLAFLWLPISVLFVKYYPLWGRVVTPGGMTFTGVADQKNGLGMICLVSGIYFCWNLLLNQAGGSKLARRLGISKFILIGMIVWLIYISQSATSLACLVIAFGIVIMGRAKFVAEKPNRAIVIITIAAFVYVIVNTTVDLKGIFIELLNRDETLTTRTNIWEAVKELATNPIVGTGYQSFWLGERRERIWEIVGTPINQAHNGYLEQYVNLGYIGLGFIGALMFSGLLKVRAQLKVDYAAGMLKLCFIVIAIMYNYTEASFYGINNIWLLTLFAIIEIRPQMFQKSCEARSGCPGGYGIVSS